MKQITRFKNYSKAIVTSAIFAAVLHPKALVMAQQDDSQERPVSIGAAVFSPDGKHVTYGSNVDGDMEIYIMDANGSNRRQLTRNTFSDHTATFTPDGSAIIYVEGNFEAYGSSRLMKIDISKEDDPEYKPEIVGGFHGHVNYHPLVEQDGRITFSSLKMGNFADRDIYTLDPETNDYRILVDGPLTDERGDWSSDGSRYVFSSARDWPDSNPEQNDRRFEVYITDKFGRNPTRLTHFPVDEDPSIEFAGARFPQFLPHSRKVVYVSDKDGERRGDNAIYILDLDFGEETRHIPPGMTAFRHADIHPSGKSMLVVGQMDDDPNSELVLWTIDSNEISLLVDN